GFFNGTAAFGPYNLTSAGSTDIFVAKLDSNGTVRWAKRMGSPFQDVGYGLTVDMSGSLYATGYFSGTAAFGSYNLTSVDSHDIFVMKLDGSDGTVQWAKRMGGGGG